jgi:hypothetical protein
MRGRILAATTAYACLPGVGAVSGFRFSLLAIGFVLTAATDAPPLTALAGIESGQWVLRSSTPGTLPRTICLGDPRLLLQIQHPAATCTRFVIANDPRTTIVHYTCPAAAGHGRTTVRVESPRLIHIDSQGFANREPFDWSLEGRRTGLCPVTAAAVPAPASASKPATKR